MISKHALISWLRPCLFGILALGLAGLAVAERGVPAANGILNFGQVDDRIYRGAQPDTIAIENLKKLGVRSLVDLRMPGEGVAREAAAARSAGLVHTNIALRGFSRPTPAQINAALACLTNLPAPIFVHCEHGCDRTGTLIACYRIAHDQWRETRALHEAEVYGISRLEKGMRQYIIDFARSRHPEPAKAP